MLGQVVIRGTRWTAVTEGETILKWSHNLPSYISVFPRLNPVRALPHLINKQTKHGVPIFRARNQKNQGIKPNLSVGEAVLLPGSYFFTPLTPALPPPLYTVFAFTYLFLQCLWREWFTYASYKGGKDGNRCVFTYSIAAILPPRKRMGQP